MVGQTPDAMYAQEYSLSSPLKKDKPDFYWKPGLSCIKCTNQGGQARAHIGSAFSQDPVYHQLTKFRRQAGKVGAEARHTYY